MDEKPSLGANLGVGWPPKYVKWTIPTHLEAVCKSWTYLAKMGQSHNLLILANWAQFWCGVRKHTTKCPHSHWMQNVLSLDGVCASPMDWRDQNSCPKDLQVAQPLCTPTRRNKDAFSPSRKGPHGSGNSLHDHPFPTDDSHYLSSVNMQGNTTLVHRHHSFYESLIQGRRMESTCTTTFRPFTATS